MQTPGGECFRKREWQLQRPWGRKECTCGVGTIRRLECLLHSEWGELEEMKSERWAQCSKHRTQGFTGLCRADIT